MLLSELRPDRRRAGLSGSGTITIAAIVSVLVFVSLPRLRTMALHENELDARATALALARELPLHDEDSRAVPAIATLLRVNELSRQLADSELLDGGRRLRRHGYVFEVVRLPEEPLVLAGFGLARLAMARPGPAARLGVLAWPWRHGRTGSAALLATREALWEHENVPVRWEGPAPAAGLLEDWRDWRRCR